MPDLLLELLSEEIPARMQATAADDFHRLLTDRITDAGLAFTAATAWVTPRRLAISVEGLPDRQPDRTEDRKGPKVGAPDQAVAGFLKAAGLDSLDQAEQRTVKGHPTWFAVSRRPGRPTADLLPDMVRAVVARFPWPKSMRWADGTQGWVRPLRQGLCRFGGETVAFTLAFGSGEANAVAVGGTTLGHRFLAPEAIAPIDPADYKARLHAARVMLDPADRRAAIQAGADALAARHGLTVKPDAGLLDEVAGLVEWPVPLLGRIDEAFMALPPEVLTTSMRSHQKYFALTDADGALAPRFVVVANIDAADGGAAIVAGNERVLRARLADARFFWDQDRATPLADRVPRLASIVFHARLGSVADKVARLESLAADLAGHIPDCDRDQAMTAARLAKADLVTGMVGEFPDLQGIMGRYHARADGAADAVAEAIASHYAPLGPADACPTAPVSVAVALADKIDTLVGFWAIDEKPTGSKDPFALRRAALGVIRLVLENRLRLPLSDLFGRAARLHRADAAGSGRSDDWDADAAIADLLAFFADRLKAHLRDAGVRHDLVAAVFAVGKPDGGGDDDLLRLLARAEALKRFLDSDDGANLLHAYRRAANILRIEEKRDGRRYAGLAREAGLRQAEETALFAALLAAQQRSRPAMQREAYGEVMAVLARLRAPVDAFFDAVTVNADDPALRENRLILLSGIRDTLGTVADFARIEG